MPELKSVPYVYFIYWSKTQVGYVGCRYSKDCTPDDLWKTYFTSSESVKKYRQKHGEPDKIYTIPTGDKDPLHIENLLLTKAHFMYDGGTFLNKTTQGGLYTPFTDDQVVECFNKVRSIDEAAYCLDVSYHKVYRILCEKKGVDYRYMNWRVGRLAIKNIDTLIMEEKILKYGDYNKDYRNKQEYVIKRRSRKRKFRPDILKRMKKVLELRIHYNSLVSDEELEFVNKALCYVNSGCKPINVSGALGF